MLDNVCYTVESRRILSGFVCAAIVVNKIFCIEHINRQGVIISRINENIVRIHRARSLGALNYVWMQHHQSYIRMPTMYDRGEITQSEERFPMWVSGKLDF